MKISGKAKRWELCKKSVGKWRDVHPYLHFRTLKIICEHAKGKRIIKSTTCTCPRLGMGLTSALASAVPCRKCQLKIYWTICATVGIGILRGKSINGAHVLMDKESTEKSKDHAMWELLNLECIKLQRKEEDSHIYGSEIKSNHPTAREVHTGTLQREKIRNFET